MSKASTNSSRRAPMSTAFSVVGSSDAAANPTSASVNQQAAVMVTSPFSIRRNAEVFLRWQRNKKRLRFPK